MAFPADNYASLIRGFQSDGIVNVPRPAFTWFILFDVNRSADTSGFISANGDGRMMAALKTASHPQVTFKTETLNSYNTVRRVPVKMEYKPFSVTFYDDSSSVITKMLKSYRSFYNFSADAVSELDFGDLVGMNARQSSQLQSTGMKMRSGDRNFFYKILLFDLGTDPSNVNVYGFVNPVIADISNTDLNYDEGTGLNTITLAFEYEGYFEKIGTPIGNWNSIFSQIGKSGSGMNLTIDGSTTPQFSSNPGGLSDISGIINGSGNRIISNLAPVVMSRLTSGNYSSSSFTDPLVNKNAAGNVIQTVRSALQLATTAVPSTNNPTQLLNYAINAGSTVSRIASSTLPFLSSSSNVNQSEYSRPTTSSLSRSNVDDITWNTPDSISSATNNTDASFSSGLIDA